MCVLRCMCLCVLMCLQMRVFMCVCPNLHRPLGGWLPLMFRTDPPAWSDASFRVCVRVCRCVCGFRCVLHAVCACLPACMCACVCGFECVCDRKRTHPHAHTHHALTHTPSTCLSGQVYAPLGSFTLPPCADGEPRWVSIVCARLCVCTQWVSIVCVPVCACVPVCVCVCVRDG